MSIKNLLPLSETSRRLQEKKMTQIVNDPEAARHCINRFKEKAEAETAKKNHWRLKHQNSQQTVKSLQIQLKNQKIDIRALQDSLDEANRHISVLEKIIEDLKKEVRDKSESISGYLTKLAREKSRYKAEVKKIKDNFKEKLLEMQEVIKNLRRQLDVKDQKLEDLYNSNKRMIRQLNADSHNSGWTTATDDRNPGKQKKNTVNLHNSRTKTGRKPGGQKGHPGHRRKWYKPDNFIRLPEPKLVREHPDDYHLIGEKERRVTDIQISTSTTSYISNVYRNVKTGETIYTPFPAGIVNEQNYGEQIRALAFIMTTVCNVSINKTAQFIRDITGGKISLSTGMINNLSESFSKAGEAERQNIYRRLIGGHYMNHDLTLVKVNGKKMPVAISSNPENVQLDLLSDKTKESIKSGPIKDFPGIGITDHDPSYRTLFRLRQECLVHLFRYLKDSQENEPQRQWNIKMDDFLHTLVKNRDKGMSETEIREAEAEYLKILDEGLAEYKKNPPEAWYPDGKNTLERMKEAPEDYLRFLRDSEIPWHNNDAEVVARQIKRKQKMAGTFRSTKGIANYLNNLALLLTAKRQGKKLFDIVLQHMKK